MRTLNILIAALSVAAATPAFAEHAYPQNDAQSSFSASASDKAVESTKDYGGSSDGSHTAGARGKSRAEVYGELIQAQRDGLVQSSKIDYPPSEQSIGRNKELYQIRHR